MTIIAETRSLPVSLILTGHARTYLKWIEHHTHHCYVDILNGLSSMSGHSLVKSAVIQYTVSFSLLKTTKFSDKTKCR
ncbi:hypothetical protein BRADI_2g36506v3 [Brachypodium distachyon]|uniref:Uncharacterized protein n=1 Tax=Brachypodium distachyon TaxID=15368 RepID=A0A0Q3GAR9_BRADI|nr:hypothetical protein BRADI_2g36506v3 [Brachypodium distachyon]